MGLKNLGGASGDSRQNIRESTRVGGSSASAGRNRPEEVRRSDLQITNLRFPDDIGVYYITFGFETYSRPSIFSKGKSDATAQIALPLPNKLNNVSLLEFTDHAAGSLGGLLEAYKAGDVGAAGGIVGGAVANGLADGLQTFLGNRAIQQQLGGASGLGATVAGDVLNGIRNNAEIGLQALGYASNPFLTVLFKGPTFKTHEFVWRLSPKTPAETENIKNIIKLLKYHAHPDVAFGKLFTYPSICVPRLHPKEDYLYEFKRCVIETVSENYTPGDTGSFHAGTQAPTTIDLAIRIKEIELWTKPDFG